MNFVNLKAEHLDVPLYALSIQLSGQLKLTVLQGYITGSSDVTLVPII